MAKPEMPHHQMPSRLALGTAQFGMDYGIANRGGRPSTAEVERILTFAHSVGIDLLDTAVAYGDSEAVLGQIGIAGWRVVSKIPATFDPVTDSLRELVEGSLGRLGIESLYGLLLHDSSLLLSPSHDRLCAELGRLQADGMVDHIGISVYEPDRLESLINAAALGIVQAPLNLLDQRMLTSGWVGRLYEQGIEVHARSLFLQGLLLTPEDRLPARFQRHSEYISRFHAWRNSSECSALGACLGFVLEQPGVSQAVVGVDSAAQLQEILQALPDQAIPDPSVVACCELDLIDPRRWARG